MWLIEGTETLDGDEIGFAVQIEWVCEATRSDGAIFKSARIRPIRWQSNWEEERRTTFPRPLATWRDAPRDLLEMLLGSDAINRIETEAERQFENNGGWPSVEAGWREDRISQREAV